MDNKEYKVVTSNTPSFGNPEKLKKILAEEAGAGWDLVEVIDTHKIRLERDKSARANDAGCKIDPYRINVGINNAVYLGSAAIITIIVVWGIIQAASMAA